MTQRYVTTSGVEMPLTGLERHLIDTAWHIEIPCSQKNGFSGYRTLKQNDFYAPRRSRSTRLRHYSCRPDCGRDRTLAATPERNSGAPHTRRSAPSHG